jgi:hypothetical protein
VVAECDSGLMVSAILAERNSRLLNALAGACRTQNTCLMTGNRGGGEITPGLSDLFHTVTSSG